MTTAYYLDHVSSSLVSFNSESGKFAPALAEKWHSTPDGTHVFLLKEDIRFHDGTPITVKDVLWSIKRQLIRKTATHFRFWEYIKGCERLKTLNDDCEGLFAISDREIGIRLVEHADSFYLQMASPETGIFSAADMNPETSGLKPTKFSGPYFVSGRDEKSAQLIRNPNSPISKAFPDSPRSIRLVIVPVSKMDEALKAKEVDLMIRSYRPYGDQDWKSLGLLSQETANSTIIYLSGTGRKDRKPVGRRFIEKIWELNRDPKINPAHSFLPFKGTGTLDKEEFLSALPEESERKLRILCPIGFFADGFLDIIKQAGIATSTEIEFHFLPGPEWNSMFDDPTASEKYDYILSSYAASERYPTVQLRYLTGSLSDAPIDLKKVESPGSTLDRNQMLKDYQKWALQTRQVIPLFFNRTLFVFQNNIDIGAQSSTDAEIELWRVMAKSK